MVDVGDTDKPVTSTGADTASDISAAIVSLTRELVSIPSHDDETAVGDKIEQWLRAETDAVVERDDSGNVLARRSPPGKRAPRSVRDESRPVFALVGHHDVVPPDVSQVVGDTIDTASRYTIDERDGRLYGRGTADMKGAVAACMLAFRDATPSSDGPDVAFASFVGEEAGGIGVRAAIDEGFSLEYALIAEGSTNYSKQGVTDVVIAHKGRRASTLIATGNAAHASEPESGTNAIYRANDAIEVLRSLPFPKTTVLGAELGGSLTVTEINGGTAWNVIPERCTVTIDERTVPGERAPLERAAIDGVELEIEQDLPPMACADDEFADLVLESARAVQTKSTGHDKTEDGAEKPEHVSKPHATDAGWLAADGTACVVCGPAEPGEAHTATESVSIDVLRRCYGIYKSTTESLDTVSEVA